MPEDLLEKLSLEAIGHKHSDRASFFIQRFQKERLVFSEIVNRTNSERPLHEYLKVHPSILLHAMMDGFYNSASERSCLFSELALGAEYRTDFAFCNGNSMGMQWTFVELERANVPLFTKSGDPTKYLSHALRQVTEWRAWVDDYQQYALDTLHQVIMDSSLEWCWPKIFIKQPRLVIIIGRRSMLTDKSNRLRIQLCRNINGLEIITYDRLFDDYRVDKTEKLSAEDHRVVREYIEKTANKANSADAKSRAAD